MTNCNSISNEEYSKICGNVHSNYNKGISMYNTIGFVAGFGVIFRVVVEHID